MYEFLAGFGLGLWISTFAIALGIIYLRMRGFFRFYPRGKTPPEEWQEVRKMIFEDRREMAGLKEEVQIMKEAVLESGMTEKEVKE